MINMDSKMVDYEPISRAKVHKGIYKTFLKHKDFVLQSFNKFKEEFPNYDIMVTGIIFFFFFFIFFLFFIFFIYFFICLLFKIGHSMGNNQNNL